MPGAASAQQKLQARPGPFQTMEKPTPANLVTSYCNFYEFGTDKEDPPRFAPKMLKTRPWTVQVDGAVKKPQTFDIDELMKLAPLEERVYRLRCVEAWSAVVPWVGFPLAELIRRVEPTGNARFVEFVTLADRKQMPGLGSRVIDWPYTEGLRIDEAMHPLTLLDVRDVRRCAAGAERRSGARRRAVEVRLQERQVAGAGSASSRSSPRPRGRSPTRPSTASTRT